MRLRDSYQIVAQTIEMGCGLFYLLIAAGKDYSLL